MKTVKNKNTWLSVVSLGQLLHGGLMVMVMICSPLAWSGDEKRISSGTDWARFKISDYHNYTEIRWGDDLGDRLRFLHDCHSSSSCRNGSNLEVMSLLATGKVGIKTQTPINTFDVNGWMNAKGLDLGKGANTASHLPGWLQFNPQDGTLGTALYHRFSLSTHGNDRLTITPGGRVSIGTNRYYPNAKLDVDGDIRATGMTINQGGPTDLTQVSINTDTKVEDVALTVGGAVHIGPKDGNLHNFDYSEGVSEFLLWVEKGIVTEDFKLVGIRNWRDDVFEPDYKLLSLKDVEAFIKKNKHLPGVPSAEKVLAEGYRLHEIQLAFLEKIEELYLYTLEQERRITAQDELLAEQSRQIAVQNKQIDKMVINQQKMLARYDNKQLLSH